MKLAYLLLCLAVCLLAGACASGPREPMPPDIPEQTEEYFVEFKTWTEGGQIRAERVNSPQTREPKGEAPRAFRVTVRLHKPMGLAGSATIWRGAFLYPPYDKEFGRIQCFYQWNEKEHSRNVFTTQSFGDTSETWHEGKFLVKAELMPDLDKGSSQLVEFRAVVVFEGDDAWTVDPPSLSIEAEDQKPLVVPLFAEK